MKSILIITLIQVSTIEVLKNSTYDHHVFEQNLSLIFSHPHYPSRKNNRLDLYKQKFLFWLSIGFPTEQCSAVYHVLYQKIKLHSKKDLDGYRWTVSWSEFGKNAEPSGAGDRNHYEEKIWDHISLLVQWLTQSVWWCLSKPFKARVHCSWKISWLD